MKKIILFLFFFILMIGIANIKAAASGTGKNGDEEWVIMPAGAKPAYMGIHGGTMPVSLLVSRDGTALLSFVGLTGNDFLEVLRKAYLPFPSFSNSTRGNYMRNMSRRTDLFAGNATASMPVNALSGDLLTNKMLIRQLQPFGLSAEPLSIEGQVSKPASFTRPKQYRVFSLTDYFQPARAN